MIENITKPEEIQSAWEHGANIITVNYATIKQLVSDEKTTEMVTTFLNDFQEWMT